MEVNQEIKKLISEHDTRYFLSLEEIKNIDDYFERFGKKHRKNLLRDLKILEETNYEVKWSRKSHANEFMELSRDRFGEESDFNDPDNRSEMISFGKYLEDTNKTYSLLIYIDGKLEGVEVAAIHNGKYYVINGGYNPDIKNLGKLLIIEHIKKSIELGAKEIDFLVGDSGWKNLWNLDEEGCYSIKKQ